MLTGDLVRVSRRGGRVVPMFLRAQAFSEAVALSTEIIDVVASSVGRRVAEADAELEPLIAHARNRKVASGLAKLVFDRCELSSAPKEQSAALRKKVFLAAAHARRQLGLHDSFDRDALIAQAAEESGTTAAELQEQLFADLPAAQRVIGFEPISPSALVQRYNLALAQGVLIKSARVTLGLAPSCAPRIRAIFARIKFCRLMHRVESRGDGGYQIAIDGPMSLFESTQKYGVQLAQLLATVAAGDGWELSADVLWGPERQPLTFVLTDRDGLVSSGRGQTVTLEEIEQLECTFSNLNSDWTVSRDAAILPLPGGSVFLPDLCFTHSKTQLQVYLEAFGYWNRDGVFARVEQLRNLAGSPVILAVSRKLRVSAEIAGDSFPGQILVYSGAIGARAVLGILEKVATPKAAGR